MDDIKPPPTENTDPPSSPMPEPVAEQRPETLPQTDSNQTPSEPANTPESTEEHAVVHDQKPPTPATPKPSNSSSVPVLPIFLAIVIAGAMIGVAVYLALKE